MCRDRKDRFRLIYYSSRDFWKCLLWWASVVTVSVRLSFHWKQLAQFTLQSPISRQPSMAEPPRVVGLNVGGHIYTTTLYTVTQYSDSKLGKLFSLESQVPRDQKGNYFLDRDGVLFKHVLNFLRTKKLILPDDFQDFEQFEIEAAFYGIKPLEEEVQNAKKNRKLISSGPEILRLFYSSMTQLVLAGGLAVIQRLVPNVRMLGGNVLSGPAYNFKTNDKIVEGGQAKVPIKLEQLDAFLQHVVDEGFEVKMSTFFLDGHASQAWVFVRK